MLVVGREGWHGGVIGIVAGKLAELFFRPAVVMRLSEGRYHGSARSIPGYNLAEAIELLGDDLVHGGGHAMAAGLSCAEDDLPMVRRRLNDLADRWLTEEDLTPRVPVELQLDAGDISMSLAREIARLAPFGEGNREPILMTGAVSLTDIRAIGAAGNHFKARLVGMDEPASVVGWGMGEEARVLDPSRLYRICYNLRTSCYKGTERIDLVLQDAPVEDV